MINVYQIIIWAEQATAPLFCAYLLPDALNEFRFMVPSGRRKVYAL